VLTDANVLPERDVILEERNMRVDNDPGAKLSEQVLASLYLNHPYHHPTIGWRHEMETLNREDALSFYGRFYAPNNAVLVVAGDVDSDEVKTLATETYGKVARRGDVGARTRPQEPVQIAPRQVTLADPRVSQPSVQRSYLVPSRTTAKGDESYALDVLAHILGGGSNSLLYRTLVIDKRIATSAGGWYQGTSLDATRFGVYVTPAPGVSLAKAEAALDDVVADVIEKGIPAEDVERSKNRMIADYIYAQDNQSTLAQLYGAALMTGQTVEDVQARPQRLRAVTTEAVREAARRFLDKRRSVTGYLVKDIKDVAGREEKRS
jgi:zinc protease